MDKFLAYENGRFVAAAEVTIPLDDAGFVLGATVSEQLRTFRGVLFRLDDHLSRLDRSLDIVGVRPSCTLSALADSAVELSRQNHRQLDATDDLGLAILVTPGPYATFTSAAVAGPRVIMHCYPLPFQLWAAKYTAGVSLVVTSRRHVPPECWPRELKCRSRMHYYLADREAEGIEPGSRAIFLDADGCLTETATANVVVYRRGDGLVTPPADRVLPGISLRTVRELAAGLELPFREAALSVDDLAGADEAMLCGTSHCLLPVTRFMGRPIGGGKPGSIFSRLIEAWSDRVGVNIVEQAARCAAR